MVTYRKDETQRPEGWNKGAPPHVGWWLAKDRLPLVGNEWRFFDGVAWSIFCREREDGSDGERYSDFNINEIEWSWYWPENARVARVNPETGDVTGSGPCPYETSGQAWPFGDVKKKAADAPKLKKKPAGNSKVTRYVVMVGYGLGTTYPTATFERKKNAVEYIEREARSGRYETIYIDAIRFRTPE